MAAGSCSSSRSAAIGSGRTPPCSSRRRATPEGRIVDVGAGVGAVGLALAQRNPLASVDLVEIDPELAALAERNAERNGLQARTRVLRLDALNPGSAARRGWRNRPVASSPTRHSSTPTRSAPLPTQAKRERMSWPAAEAGATLADWIQASLAILAPGGRFVMIHRPDALSVILAAIGGRLGALALLPVHPTTGASAHRLLVSGVKGSKAPLRLAPGLVLHGPTAD